MNLRKSNDPMHIRQVDLVHIKREDMSIRKFKEARWNKTGNDDWIKEALIGLFVIAFILLIVGMVNYF